jgi:uncharacterized membrane protein YtjA (UPF0391 family)
LRRLSHGNGSAAEFISPAKGRLLCLSKGRPGKRGIFMLKWAIIALVVSLIAGALGFTGVARGAATVAKVLFVVFLVIALLFFVLLILGVGALV